MTEEYNELENWEFIDDPDIQYWKLWRNFCMDYDEGKFHKNMFFYYFEKYCHKVFSSFYSVEFRNFMQSLVN